MDALAFQVLLLVIVANSAPVLVRDVLKEHCAMPLDGGLRWRDGRPLFGPSKTLRGVVVAIGATALVGWLLGLGVWFGALIGAFAMLGDLLSSFIKRRRGLPPSSRAFGLDQLPETLLPAGLAVIVQGLSWVGVFVVVAVFFVLEVTLSPVLFKLGLRQRPY